MSTGAKMLVSRGGVRGVEGVGGVITEGDVVVPISVISLIVPCEEMLSSPVKLCSLEMDVVEKRLKRSLMLEVNESG